MKVVPLQAFIPIPQVLQHLKVTAFLQHELVHTAESKCVALKSEKLILLNWWYRLEGFYKCPTEGNMVLRENFENSHPHTIPISHCEGCEFLAFLRHHCAFPPEGYTHSCERKLSWTATVLRRKVSCLLRSHPIPEAAEGRYPGYLQL